MINVSFTYKKRGGAHIRYHSGSLLRYQYQRGYHEIQSPRERKSLIDHENLIGLFGFRSPDEFRRRYRDLVSDSLEKESYRKRQSWWTESIAFGGKGFVREVKEKLGVKAIWREIVGADGSYELREPIGAYEADFAPKNDGLKQENAFYWDRSL